MTLREGHSACQWYLASSGMCPFDLTAVHRLPPVGHMYEQIRIIRGSGDGIGKHLHFTVRQRQERRLDRKERGSGGITA
jgi:hypothetical protein